MLHASPLDRPGRAACGPSSTTASADAGRGGSSRGSRCDQTSPPPSRPGGARSSVAPGQPRRAAAPPRRSGQHGQPRRARPRSRGKKGATATRAPESQRLGAARVVEVQPLHHGLRVALGAGRHLRGTARLGDLIERQETLAGALMRRAGGQLTQVFRCLAPPVIVNAQHARSRYSPIRLPP